MTGRERVLKAVSFQPTDRLPKDLGGMGSSGISCFAYEKLRRHCGLPPQPTKVWDTGQMLALPDLDVLDLLGCDVVTLTGTGATNAFPQPPLWQPYTFNGRLPTGVVMHPEDFAVRKDGTIVQWGSAYMVPGSSVFDTEHAGQIMNVYDEELMKEEPADIEREMNACMPTDAELRNLENTARRIRDESDRALFFSGYNAVFGFRGGIVNYSMLCLLEPDYVRDVHTLMTRLNTRRLMAYLQAVGPYVDIMTSTCEDMGTQNATIISPQTFRELFWPYMLQVNLALRKACPHIKTFMHSCGAIFDILDDIMEMGVDILNPVQWSAGGHSFREWKDKTRGRMALWGGGVNSQVTLPFGSVDDVRAEVGEVCRCMKQGSGYVFNNIHNLLADIPPEKILAMYAEAGRY